MGEGGRRQAARRRVELDVALHPIDSAGDGRAEEQQQQQPVLERDIGRQREEIEADVLAEHRIALAIGHLVEEAKHRVPVRDLDGGGQQAEQDGRAGDGKASRDVRRHVAEKRQRGLRRLRRRRRPGAAAWPAARRAKRSASLPESQNAAGRDGEDGEEEAGAGGEDRPEDAFIADRRKPQPVDQGVAHAPEHDQAKDEDPDQDRNVFHTHGAASFRGCCIGRGLLAQSSIPGRRG